MFGRGDSRTIKGELFLLTLSLSFGILLLLLLFMFVDDARFFCLLVYLSDLLKDLVLLILIQHVITVH